MAAYAPLAPYPLGLARSSAGGGGGGGGGKTLAGVGGVEGEREEGGEREEKP